MIVKIPTIIVTAKDKTYKLTRADFQFVRMLVLSSRDTSQEETAERLTHILNSSLKFKNKKAFTLTLEALAVDISGFTVDSTSTKLSEWDRHYMSNLIECAAGQPDTVVILPSYIKVVSPALEALKEASPKKKRTPRKPKKKSGGKS